MIRSAYTLSLSLYSRLRAGGVLGANAMYPQIMKDSLKLTRVVRRELGYKVSQNPKKDHVIKEIDAPWEVIAEHDSEIMEKYRTNSYTRRTDDVVWLWAADDLFIKHSIMSACVPISSILTISNLAIL